MYILRGLIYLKIISSRSQRQRSPKFIPFKLTDRRRQKFLMDLAWSFSRLQIKGKYSGRSPYIFFTLVTSVCFLLRIKQKWCFKMGPLCSLSLVCTEYLMHRSNTNGIKLEYLIHITILNKYFYGNTEFSPFGCHFLLRITGFRAFASGWTSL